MIRSTLFRFAPALMLGCAPLGMAQTPAKEPGLTFECSLGSFKIIDGKGSASFDFKGTVVLADVKGTVTTSGNLRKEYDSAKGKRVAYFGQGSIKVVGSWRGIQAFGGGYKGHLTGSCHFRMTGEFDKDMKTGTYWYDDEPNAKHPWFTQSFEVPLPPNRTYITTPKPRSGGG